MLLPRQGDLRTTIRVIELAPGNKVKLSKRLHKSEQIINYHQKNAQILGLLDASLRRTPEGEVLLRLDPELQIGRLSYSFELSEVGQMWMGWAEVKTLDDLKPETAHPFLMYLAGSEAWNTTWDQYESTLRKWCRDFKCARKQLPLPREPSREPEVVHPLPATRVVFERLDSGQVIRSLAAFRSQADVATGFFSIGGYKILAENLARADLRILIGDDERSTGELRELLQRFRASLDEELGGDLAEARRTIEAYHERTIRGHIRLRSLEGAKRGRLHAKVYLFETERAYITSANLTRNGLVHNIEAGQVVEEPTAVTYLQNKFNELFEHATPLEARVLREIEKSWAIRGLEDPYHVFLKILLELFGSLDRPSNEQRFQLAEFQKAIVAALLGRFESRRGVLLIAPTGLGKTIIAAHTARLLKDQGRIERITVVCKNAGMRDMWTRVLRTFRIVPETIKVYDLERADLEDGSDDSFEELFEVFRSLDTVDLVIVDECHHFRNRISHRSETLRTFLHGPGNREDRPYVLQLTATPVSTGHENINNLLHLISDETIENISGLAQAEHALNITLGGVLRQFGRIEGSYYGLTLRDEQLFFPKVEIKTVKYESSQHRVFQVLHRHRKLLTEARVNMRDLGIVESGSEPAAPALLIVLLTRLAESSPAALEVSISRLLDRIERGLLKLKGTAALANVLLEIRQQIVPESQDAKLNELLKQIESMQPREKLLVFSEFVKTVEYTAEAIKRRFPKRHVAAITGETPHTQRRKYFRRFAHVAQCAPRPTAARELDVLVASDAISEGENLQDANYVINYDLPWTPLKLIQRIGRADRFTTEQRIVRVFNYFPIDPLYEEILAHWQRLETRDGERAGVSGQRVIGERVRHDPELVRKTIEAAQQLAEGGQDYLSFRIEDDDSLPPTHLFETLWGATAADRALAKQLPDGVQAVTRGETPGVYILLRRGGQRWALFCEDGTARIRVAPTDYSHERLLDLIKPVTLEPGRGAPRSHGVFDGEISRILRDWFAKHPEFSPDTFHIIAALRVLPGSKPRPPELGNFVRKGLQIDLFGEPEHG